MTSKATSLLSRIISADDGPGGELTRHLALLSPSPPLATKFRFHRPLMLRLPRPLCWPLGSISSAISAPYNARLTSRAHVHPPLLLCPLQLFSHWYCNDRPAPVIGFSTSPPPGRSHPNKGGCRNPQGGNSAPSLLGKALNSSQPPSDISAAPPVVLVDAANVIIVVIDGTPVSMLSLHIVQPITCGPPPRHPNPVPLTTRDDHHAVVNSDDPGCP
jgi:hypothetical protein